MLYYEPMKHPLFGLGVALLCIVGTPVFAANTTIDANEIFPEVDVEHVTKPSDASAQVQFLSETNALIEEPAKNDIYAFAGTVSIENTVDGDVFAAANEISILKKVSGSVRVAGNTVIIKGSVTRNTVIMANTVTINEGAELKGNVRIFANTLTMNGTISGAANIMVNTLEGSGRYLADTVIEARHQDATLHNEDKNRITIKESTNTLRGTVTHVLKTVGKIVYILLTICFGMLVIVFGYDRVTRAITTLNETPTRAFFKGILISIGIFFAILFLCLTIVGIPFGLVVACLYVFSLWVGKTIVAYWVGLKICNTQPSRDSLLHIAGCFLLGFALLSIISHLPYIGWLFSDIVALLGVGAISLTFKK